MTNSIGLIIDFERGIINSNFYLFSLSFSFSHSVVFFKYILIGSNFFFFLFLSFHTHTFEQSKAIILVTLIAAVNCAFPANNYNNHFNRQQQYQRQRNYNYQPGPDAQAQILRNDQEVNPQSFQYAYETSNGIQAQEAGQLRQIGREQAVVAQGSYSYTSPEGEPISISYIADENGKLETSHIN